MSDFRKFDPLRVTDMFSGLLSLGPGVNPAEIPNEESALETAIANSAGSLKQLKRKRLPQLVVLTVAGLTTVAVLSLFLETLPSFKTAGTLTPTLVSAWYVLIILMGVYFRIQAHESNLEVQLDTLSTRLGILRRLSPSQDPARAPTYFDNLVQINVENLSAYYSLVKAHTNNSFRVSIVAGSVGFMLIVTGLGAGFLSQQPTQTLSYITTGAGVVSEFIGAVFFYLYNRTVRQLKDYHDSLLSVQNVLLAFKLVGDTKDETEKAKLVGQILGYLVSRNTDYHRYGHSEWTGDAPLLSPPRTPVDKPRRGKRSKTTSSSEVG